MVRSKDPALRQALLEKAVAYALRHGVAGLTLRPLAAEIGASARMLMHHFGSKEALVGEVLARIELDLGATLLAEAKPGDTLKTVMLRFWDRLAEPELQPLLRSMFEVWGQALVRPAQYQPFLDVVVTPWTAFIAARLIETGWAHADAESTALACTGAFHGLQLIRLTTDNTAAGRSALAAFIDRFDQSPGTSS